VPRIEFLELEDLGIAFVPSAGAEVLMEALQTVPSEIGVQHEL
jgi:hypothetical protein